MSAYTALARRWRPRTFAEMTGQEHVLKALSNALASGRVHHAFLFSGTRGVGKTTVARILAKCLNCERGVSATPCGECASCREIDAGRSVDLIEVDAASRTRVDDTRELLDNVQYAPTRSRYKIYLIDEVHMLSAHSFNALLKTLEEPPPHVKFLLATTDPQKLPVTVLSRCLQFNLKRLPVTLISARLRHILDAEQIGYEPAALQLIAIAGDGSLRDALSLLDQLLAYGNGRADEADARAMLGTVDREHAVRLARLLVRRQPAELMNYAQSLEELAPDYAQLLEQLAALLERVALRQIVPDYAGDELHPPELLAELAGELPAEDLQLYYQTALIGRRDLPLAPDERAGFRMTLMRMLAFRPGGAAAGSAAPAATGGAGTGVRAGAAPGGAAASASATSTAGAAASAASAAGPGSVSAAGTAPAGADAGATAWSELVGQLDIGGVTRQLAANCSLLSHADGVLRLALDPRSAALRTRAQEDKLAQALARHLGTAVRVEIDVREPPADTPARVDERAAAESRAEARTALEGDPAVAALRQRFSAALVPESVQPQKRS
jgi:DNA polymerase-3 subunit gamma/tau